MIYGLNSLRNKDKGHRLKRACASYSTNKYDVKAGVKDTHALGKYFNGLAGKPNRVYVIGHSMGGHVTAKIIEQYPAAYDGALPMCGVMGDTELYDYFLSYQLDDDPALTPEEEALSDMVLRVQADPQGKKPNGLANIPPVAGDPTRKLC